MLARFLWMCRQSWPAIVIIGVATVFLSIFVVRWAAFVLPTVLVIVLIWFAALRGPEDGA